MIGKGWLLKGYHDWYQDTHGCDSELDHVHIVEVLYDDGWFWACQFWHSQYEWVTMGVPKRFIEFIPPYMLDEPDDYEWMY